MTARRLLAVPATALTLLLLPAAPAAAQGIPPLPADLPPPPDGSNDRCVYRYDPDSGTWVRAYCVPLGRDTVLEMLSSKELS